MPKKRRNRSRSKRRVSRRTKRRTKRRTRRTRRTKRRTRRTRRIRGGSGVDGKGSPETYKEWEDLLGGDPQEEEELDDKAEAGTGPYLPTRWQTSVPSDVIYGAPEGLQDDDEAGKRLPGGHWNVASSTAPPVPSFVAPVPVPSFDMPSASAREKFIMDSSGVQLRKALGIRHKNHDNSTLQKKARRNPGLISKAMIRTQKYKGSHKGNK